jgi:hypothetical protein
MQQTDSTTSDDIRRVRETFDGTVLPFLVNFRDELLEKAELSISNSVRRLNKCIRSESDFLSTLSQIDELRSELDKISESISDRDRIQDFYQALGTWQHDLPTKRDYPQNSVCYSKLPSDTSYQRLGKWLKRTRLSLKSGFHSVKMRFRKALGKEVSEFPAEIHEIRWVRVSKSLSVELLEQIAIISYEDFGLFSKIAALLNHICDFGKDPIKLEQQLRLAQNLQREIKDLRAANPVRLKEICDEVFEQIIAKVEFMGTFQESRHHFNTKVLDSRDEKALKSIKKLKSDWRKDCRTRLSQLQIDINLHHFNDLSSKEIKKFQAKVDSKLKEILGHSKSTTGFLRAQAEAYKAEKASSIRSKSFKSKLEATKSEIISHLESDFSRTVLGIMDDMDMSTSMETALSNSILNDELLPVHSYVFDSEPKEPVKAQTSFETLNFRNELTTYIKNDLFRKLRKVPVEISNDLEKLRIDIDEIQQVASVNIVLALDLLEDTDSKEENEKVLELIFLGIDRAAKRVDELVAKLEHIQTKCQKSTEDLFTSYLVVAHKTMLDDNYLYIRSKNREARVVSKSLDWKSRIETTWIELWDRVILWYRFIFKVVKQLYSRGQRLLGFAPEDDESGYIQAGASEFLSETEQRFAELPLIYRRLFSEEALTEARFFRGRTTFQTMFAEAYGIWSRGHFSNFLIVGEKGSGKTSCMQLLPKLIELEQPIVRSAIATTLWTEDQLVSNLSQILGYTSARTKEELIDAINGSDERKIVLIEGFQNVFLRFIQGFEALEAFLLIISKTSSKVFWVISCSRYSWELLNKIYQTAGYFSHVRGVDNVTSDVIQEIILTRHRVSGYDLHFIPSKDMKSSRAFKKLEAEPAEQQNLVRTEFFKGLGKVAQGNISIAMLYWLRSIRNIGLDSIEIAPFSEINVTLGDAFTNDDLFALASLVQHDDLNVHELALTLNIGDHESLLTLSKLSSRAILLHKNQRYYLNPLLYRHIVNLLKLKNIVH